MEVEIGVDAVALERGDEVIQPIELVGVELILLRGATPPDAVGRDLVVGMVEADTRPDRKSFLSRQPKDE